MRLDNWFEAYGRQFPWRETRNPYAVLLAEKLLQQTVARKAVVEIYEKLLLQFPSPSELARARAEDVRTLILPLGLHYRANELVTLSEQICREHGCQVPQDLKALRALHGVGNYIARATLCFAFEERIAVIDTNVARILYRVFGLPGSMPANPARKKSLIELASSLLPDQRVRDYNFAMLDLGALICKPSAYECGSCPLNGVCEFFDSRALEVGFIKS
jgi:A/G-specific adenine glycosylase